jgi:hypothetical protein
MKRAWGPRALVSRNVPIHDAVRGSEHADGMQSRFGMFLSAEVVNTSSKEAREI